MKNSQAPDSKQTHDQMHPGRRCLRGRMRSTFDSADEHARGDSCTDARVQRQAHVRSWTEVVEPDKQVGGESKDLQSRKQRTVSAGPSCRPPRASRGPEGRPHRHLRTGTSKSGQEEQTAKPCVVPCATFKSYREVELPSTGTGARR